MRRTPTSGNPYHYQSWANSVDGVGASRVISKWNGAGTVKVVLAGADMEPASEATVAACAASHRGTAYGTSGSGRTGQEMASCSDREHWRTTTKSDVQTALVAAVTAYLRGTAASAFTDNVDLQLETLADKTYTVLYSRNAAFLLLSIPVWWTTPPCRWAAVPPTSQCPPMLCRC